MKYMVKGRDFCLDLYRVIDVMPKPMEMMTKAQSLDQYLWSVTKPWPRVTALLHTMKEVTEKQLVNDEIILQKELFPKLKHHYEDLTKEDANECKFKNVELLPGWMVIKELEEIDDVTRKKRKVIDWVDRTPEDYLMEMESLCENLCVRLLVYSLHVDRLPLLTMERKTFSLFFKYVCSSAHIIQLADDQPELCLLPALSERVHQSFKDVTVQVVWKNHGNCRKIWFPQ